MKTNQDKIRDEAEYFQAYVRAAQLGKSLFEGNGDVWDELENAAENAYCGLLKLGLDETVASQILADIRYGSSIDDALTSIIK